jgi:hypothetical protein
LEINFIALLYRNASSQHKKIENFLIDKFTGPKGTMQLFVRSPVSGRTIVLSCKNTSTIAELKDQLWQKEGIPVTRFSFFNGLHKLVDESQTVGEANIENESNLTVLIRPIHEFVLTIRPIHYNSSFSVVVTDEMKIGTLKEMVSKIDGFVSEDLRLIYKGKMLSEPEAMLKDYGIRKTATIHLMRVMKPCSCTAQTVGDCESKSHVEQAAKRRRGLEGEMYDTSGNRIFGC